MEETDFISNEIVIFKPSKGGIEFEIILDGEHDTVWVTELQITELFGKARRTIGEHIRNIFKEGELEKESTWRKFRQVQTEGEETSCLKKCDNWFDYKLSIIIKFTFSFQELTVGFCSQRMFLASFSLRLINETENCDCALVN